MSTVENYQKAKCAQISLDDGNKVLVSYGATDMRVFKMGFFMTAKNTVHIFDSEFLYNLNSKIGYDLSKDVVKILANELSKARSLEELKKTCLDLEENKDFIEKI